MKLSVVTVTFNSAELIGRLIKSLADLPKDSEIIIVDSASSDQTVAVLKKYTQVKLIEAGENVGFGKGCNIGAKQASGEYLWFLNPDTQIHTGSAQQLIDYLDQHREVGLVSPKLIEKGGKEQLAVRRLPTLFGAFREYYLGQKQAYAPYAPQVTEPLEVECVVGAAMMIRRSLFEKIGGFDARYFMYYEDTELCRQLGRLGQKIVYLPSAVVDHEVGASLSANKAQWNYQSSLVYHGWIGGQLLYWLLRFRPHR